MKKYFATAMAVVMFLCGATAVAADSGKPVTLKIADSFPIKHPMNQMVNHFMEEAKKASGGGLEFDYFPAEQLGKFKDLLKLCQQGLVDIAYIGVSYFPNELSLNSVPVLPLTTTAAEGTAAYSKLIQTSPEVQKEWANIKLRPLITVVSTEYDAATVKHPITKPEDLQGLRMKGAGGMMDKIAERYGIVPVNITIAETYEALERGILDGSIQSIPSIKSYGFQEILRYGTHGMRMGSYIAVYAINERAWKKLPEASRNALLKAGESASFFASDLWDKTQAKLVQVFKEKNNIQFTEVTSADRALWDAPLEGIEEVWINIKENKSKPAKEVYEQYRKLAAEIVK